MILNKESEVINQTIGIDEVGRGALCGPVVACSVLLDRKILDNPIYLKINDSKKLSKFKRKKLSKFIKENSTYFVGIASVREIEKYNILQATKIAMKRSFKVFSRLNLDVKVDGPEFFYLTKKTSFLIKGDSKSITIASASIIAKTFRDELMIKLSEKYPYYNWSKNKGYGTKEHIMSIKKFGVCPEHRKNFSPIKEIILKP